MNERFLDRLARSRHADLFLLKGAMLFRVWTGAMHRPTRDVDLAGRGDASLDWVRAVLREVVDSIPRGDGVLFHGEAVRVTETRTGAEYGGFRVAIPASLGSARLVARIDVAFGDSVHPEPTLRPFPTLLGHAPPRIRAYPLETAIAEKLEAICDLGAINSRMKDFYDLDRIATRFPIGGESLAPAIGATFRRRRTPIPRETPVGLTEAFAECAEKRMLWDAFRERHRIIDARQRLADVSRRLREFAMPALVAAAHERDPGVWIPSRGWADSWTEP